jgi:transposase-like protein
VVAYPAFPHEHWRQISSTNPQQRLNREVKRRANVLGIFPSECAIMRLVRMTISGILHREGTPSLTGYTSF